VGDAAINYSATEFRQYVRSQLTAMSGVGGEQGILTSTNFQAAQRGAGANLSVDVSSGLAYVLGDDVTNQGTYQVWNDATVNVTGWTVPGAGTFHHRLILQVQDKLNNGAYSGYVAVLLPVLDTGSGLPAEPNTAITLATIDIPSGTSAITNSMINDFRQRVGPVSTTKTADTSRAHATSFTNDPDLQLLNLQANSTYEVFAILRYTSGTGGGAGEGDITWQFTTGGGSGGQYVTERINIAGAFSWDPNTGWGTANTGGVGGFAQPVSVKITGMLTTGAAPASLVLQWCQNSDSGTATVMKANSFLRARRMV